MLTLEELAARYPPPRVDRELERKIARMDPGALVHVIVVLRRQPVDAVVARVDRALVPRVRALRAQIDRLLLRARAGGGRVAGADAAALRTVAAQWKQLRRERNARILREVAPLVVPEQNALVDYIRSLGGRARGGYRMVNMVAGVVPAHAVATLANHSLVAYVAEDVRASATLDVSVPSIGAPTFWTNGFDGGMWDAAVVDTGMDAGHPAFAGKTISSLVCHATAQTDPTYADDPSTGDDLQGHGTHVGGIVMSQGAAECPNCRGVARGLDVTHNLKAGFRTTTGGGLMYDSDRRTCVDSVGQQAEAVNLSFGGSTTLDYTTAAQWIDAAVRNFEFDFAVSAGNLGPAVGTVTSPAIAYNVLAVASMNDMNTTSRSDDRISSFSSRGPTVGGRRKPDLAAPGQSILAPRHSCETDTDFVNKSGTSMAAPHVTGASVLLWDAGLWSPGHDLPGMCCLLNLGRKALLINSADAWSDNGTPTDSSDDGPAVGSQWNPTYGWGYLNLANAYAQRFNVFLGGVVELDWFFGFGRSFFVVGDMAANQKATLVWHKRNEYAGVAPPSVLWALTDLDLRAYRETDGIWLGVESATALNNVEQLAVPTSTRTVLRARLSGTISGTGGEGLAIAAQGTNLEAAVAGPTVRITSAPTVCPGASFALTARLRHWGNLASHNN
ncbi:MAG: S8 family serine peptidase [Firmicutes bacterium]|nr:S8 family serine peptidase [Bacillota bacterium]